MGEERGGRGGEEEVVELEDAVKMLVEHLVRPVLPHGALPREVALSPENQEAVARQVRTTSLVVCASLLPFVWSVTPVRWGFV